MEITPEIVSFLKEVSLGAASGRLQEKAQALLASIEAVQQSVQRPKYRITLDNGDERIYSDWNTAFKAWMDNGGALEFVR